MTQADPRAIQAGTVRAGGGLRPLLLPAEGEPLWKRRLYAALAVVVAGGFLLVVMRFFAPAPGIPGIDENAYLVGGRNIARHLTPGMAQPNPYSFVGMMWDRTPAGWYYPKYPGGVPLLDAVAIWLSWGNPFAAFYVSPLCAAAAVLGMFFFTRLFASSFLALLAALVLAGNATLLQLALVPSSHAPAICFAVWGMCLLTLWWRDGRLGVGVAAGFLLGFTGTIRYSEGLLLLPLLAAAAGTVRWTQWRSCVRAAAPLLAWAAPLVALVAFNYSATGHFTGYDSTHESTGFTVAEFLNKWEFTVQELYLYGLFVLLPLGLLGMLVMFRSTWRLGLLLTLWFVPPVVLYTSYYWGTQAPGTGFLRFFLTLYPPVIAAAVWVIGAAVRGAAAGEGRSAPRRGVVLPLAAGVLAAAPAAAGVYVAAPDMLAQYHHNLNLEFSARQILRFVPARAPAGEPRPVVFIDHGLFPQLLMYMQFVADADWYSSDAFSPRMGGTLGILDIIGNRTPIPGAGDDSASAPVLIPRARLDYLETLYGGKDVRQLAAAQHQVLDAALAAGRPVYVVLPAREASLFRSRFLDDGYAMTLVARWGEPAGALEDLEPAGAMGGPARGDRSVNALAPPRMPLGLFAPEARPLEAYRVMRKAGRPS